MYFLVLFVYYFCYFLIYYHFVICSYVLAIRVVMSQGVKGWGKASGTSRLSDWKWVGGSLLWHNHVDSQYKFLYKM
jgi:hypothetical protein